jgi:uncharacterized membrane protein YcaP (DUF421 family)
MDKLWSDMFYLGLPVLEKIVRPVIVYAFLVIGLRLAGKRELAQLNPLDLVVLLMLANTVQNAIIGDDTSVTGGLVGAATLLLINYAVVRLLYGREKVEELVEGAPDALIENGQVRTERLKQELITLSELEAAAHKQGFGALDQVESAVLEPGGTIAFVGREPTLEAQHRQQVMARLDQIASELAALRAAQAASHAT